MRDNASYNKYAQYPFKVTLEEVLNSTIIADPLRLLHCSPISYGAAALVLARSDFAKQYLPKDEIVHIRASVQTSDFFSIIDRGRITEFRSVKTASEIAYDKSKSSPFKMDVIEIHDCFAVTGLILLEDIGLCKKEAPQGF